MKIKDCMCNNVACVTPDSSIQDCAKIMSDNHCGCIPVCDTLQNVVGLVTDRDVILRSIAAGKDYQTTPVSEIMTKNICSCNIEDDVKQAENLMSKYQIRRLPVLDSNNKIVGIITLGDLVKNNNVNTQDVSYTFENICKCDDKNAN